MSGALSPILGRSGGAENVGDRIDEIRQARLTELRQKAADPAAARPDRPAAAAKAETTRPVEVATEAAATQPTLSPELRSMLLATGETVMGPAHSARLIGQLLDALRAYEK